jgi:hypothetical protein
MSSNLAKKPSTLEIVHSGKNPPSSKDSPKSSKKLGIKILILVVILAGLYFGVSYFLGRSSWNSFSNALNLKFGENNWQAEGHGFSLISRTFSVKGFSLSVPDSSPSWESPKGDYSLKVDTVNLKGIPSDLSPILSRESWAGGEAQGLASGIELLGLTADKTLNSRKSSVSMDSLSLSGLALRDGSPDLPSGIDGFLKSLSLDSLEVINFKENLPSSPRIPSAISLGFNKLTAEKPLPGPNLKDPTNILDIILNISAEDIQLLGFKLTGSGNGVEFFTANLSELRLSGVSERAKFASWINRNIDLVISDPSDTNRKVSFSIGRSEAQAVDLSLPLDRIKWVIDRVSTEYYFPSPGRIYEDFVRISDAATFPISLNSLKITDLRLEGSLNSGFSIREINITGPFERSVLPTGTISVSQAIVSPTMAVGPDNKPVSLYRNFLSFLGEDSYEIDLSLAFDSDPETGSFKVKLSQLNLKGLGSLSGTFSVSGLTQNLINALAQLNLRYLNNLSFADGLKNTGIDSITLTYKDDSLINKFVNFSASINNLSPGDMIAVYKSRISDSILSKFGSYLDTAPDLSDLVGEFISAPDTLSFSLNPSQSYNHSLVETYASDKAGLYNHLKMSVTANNLPPVPFSFNENINPPASETPAETPEVETTPPAKDDEGSEAEGEGDEEGSKAESDS